MPSLNDIESAARCRTLDCLYWLMPDGKLRGDEFCALNPTRHDNRAGSFFYNVRKHLWSDFACADKGHGLISLWGYVRNKSFADAGRELAQWLGMQPCNSPAEFTRRVPSKPPAKLAKDERAALLWQNAKSPHDTAVEKYLRGRGITLSIPPTIRFLPHHKHSETSLILPVMVAAVEVWPAHNVIAVHRTFLKPDGIGKAEIEPDKKMLGRVAGGAVRLAAAAEIMAVGEGLETCLAVQQASQIPTWAALSTSGLRTLIFPDLPLAREIVIAADNDAAGISAAHKAAERWVNEGRKVRIAAPETVKDFNDLLRQS